MNGSVLTLLIGLVLLGLAAWLLWRAGTQDSDGAGSTSFDSTPLGSPDDDSSLDRAERGVDNEKNPEGPAHPGEPEPRAEVEGEVPGAVAGRVASAPAVKEADPDVNSSASPTAHSSAGSEPDTVVKPEPTGPGGDDKPQITTPEFADGGDESAAPQIVRREDEEGFRFMRGRKRRRLWAQDNGFGHVREDRRAATELPEVLVQAIQPEQLVLRDVVAGFFEGYELTIGDLGGATILRMRRPAESPVTVYYSVAGAVPAGMRRAELLDQPPFYGFTTDIRALDRMLDERVEDGLAALAHVITDVIWQDDWIVIQMSRRLDISVWEQVLPVVRSLADAAMVLPPLIMSTPLAMDVADPTRALPRGTATTGRTGSAVAADSVEHGAPLQSTTATPQAAQRSSGKPRPGHLRAVADKHVPRSQRRAQEQGSEAAGAAGTDDGGAVASERPHIERPAGPVEFPSRSTARSEGEWEHGDFPLIDETDGSIPSLGEDPDHIAGSKSQQSRVIRVDQETAIFGEELSHAAQARRRKGRHRAPDARHARPDPIEPVEAEIETVDGEIVEDQN
ncbi:type III secretion system chaperone family protein [Corynebacterium auriscanis]|uniref:hypothetical protein n=1 Tax=Corynebacterium auriscanis TaxID=99807 RepID=UPI0022466946|nr:hypothetical protein [Corynebacterium auriscanis]MCX2163835.1 hypothetical protein [Corynebacterium auriscanis]